MKQHFLRNTLGVSLVEFLWGLGMPVVMESTFLQLYLRDLGASNFLIGLIPTFFSGGLALSSLLAVSLTSHLRRKRTAVITAHVGAALPILLFGLLSLAVDLGPARMGVFFLFYGLFSLGIGLILPIWQNYLVKIFSPEQSVPALAVMWITQSVTKILGSYVILRTVERYAFATHSVSLIFALVGAVFVVASLPFLITREADEASPVPSAVGRRRHLVRSVGAALRDRNFLLFLGSDLELYGLTGIVSFYAAFATEHCGVKPSVASGLFVAAMYVGSVAANLLLGWFNLLELRRKAMLSKWVCLAGVPLVCAFCGPWAFLAASFLFGFSRATRHLVFVPAVKRISGLADATAYFAVTPVLCLPLSVGIPLLNGAVLDRLTGLGAGSYRIVFVAMGLLVAASIVLLTRVDFREGASGAPASPAEAPAAAPAAEAR
jgi:MFS family permease